MQTFRHRVQVTRRSRKAHKQTQKIALAVLAFFAVTSATLAASGVVKDDRTEFACDFL